ncbi:hypothetical protein SAMN05421640_3165 [Ekhidna lutea]|uniref:Uncharacterized protein n=1 Tax=Ekhidna lutea TaxID=447679 RepID=A0A239LEN8_EKHLU|nr:hypothetical protein [Ekhidna lutea]SNT28313.1 hypothetical protein SAMN05421640_3165 [Ekhidna lutea]
MQYLTGILTALFGLYLILLLVITGVKKDAATRYFSTFASTAKAHYLEQIIRIAIGASLVVFSSKMLGSWYYNFLGWILICTSTLLMTIPWKVHHRFGKWAIPLVIKYVWVYSALAAALGITILVSIIYPIFN